MENQEAKLKKVLGFTDVLGIAITQIIGAGILVLTGIAIGMTGSGVVFAFVISALFTIIKNTPLALMGAALPTTGGMYRYSSRLLSPKVGFFWMLMFLVVQVGVSNMALTFAMYLEGLLPGISIKSWALGILTVTFVANLFGVKTVAVVSKVMAGCLLTALGLFIAYGIPAVDYDRVFSAASLIPYGWQGFFTAVALVSFATSGAQYVAEIGGEMKNPGRDIPLAIYTATIGSAALYGLIALVASGVLPFEQVANKPLTDVARAILPAPLFLFFMVGGALCVLVAHLNVFFTCMPKGLIIACQDGWLPKRLGEVNRKFGTPHWLLFVFYMIGVIPIATGLSITSIAALGGGVGFFTYLFPFLACTQLPKKYPEAYANSRFKFKPMTINIVVALAVLLSVVQGYLLLVKLSTEVQMSIVAYIAAAAAYVYIVGKSKKYEEIKANAGFAPGQTSA